jgi:hypothetical protein
MDIFASFRVTITGIRAGQRDFAAGSIPGSSIGRPRLSLFPVCTSNPATSEVNRDV